MIALLKKYILNDLNTIIQVYVSRMSSKTSPVLYIEEVNDYGNVDSRVFVRYDGGDTYVVHMTRRDNKAFRKYPDFRMEFYTRESLVNFLLYSVCLNSTVNVTLFKMDLDELSSYDFAGYDSLYKRTRRYNELFGYDAFRFYNFEGLMELTMVLRDMRF